MVAAAQRTEWVQPIVVDATGTHLDTITAAARASVTAYLNASAGGQHDWREWLEQAFTKSVRRAKPSVLDALHTARATRVEVGRSRALAFAPVRYTELPRALSRLQVSGTDLPRELDLEVHPASASVRVAVLDTLSTGKAAAQGAHALFAWALQAADPLDTRVAVRSATVGLVAADRLADLAGALGAVPIRDAGFTEIEAGTLTAVACPVEVTR